MLTMACYPRDATYADHIFFPRADIHTDIFDKNNDHTFHYLAQNLHLLIIELKVATKVASNSSVYFHSSSSRPQSSSSSSSSMTVEDGLVVTVFLLVGLCIAAIVGIVALGKWKNLSRFKLLDNNGKFNKYLFMLFNDCLKKYQCILVRRSSDFILRSTPTNCSSSVSIIYLITI